MISMCVAPENIYVLEYCARCDDNFQICRDEIKTQTTNMRQSELLDSAGGELVT